MPSEMRAFLFKAKTMNISNKHRNGENNDKRNDK